MNKSEIYEAELAEKETELKDRDLQLENWIMRVRWIHKLALRCSWFNACHWGLFVLLKLLNRSFPVFINKISVITVACVALLLCLLAKGMHVYIMQQYKIKNATYYSQLWLPFFINLCIVISFSVFEF